MLYSQLNYLGCFLPIEDEDVQNWSNLIEKFVMGPLNIAKNRRYLTREEGGLGLFEIKTFLGSQKCNWIKRAKNLDDYWKQRIYSKSLGNIFNLREKYFNKDIEPVLHTIVSSYETFLVEHTKAKENCKEAYIFENQAIFFLDPNLRTFDAAYFDEEMRRFRYQVTNLKVSDVLLEDGSALDLVTFCNNTGIVIREAKFRCMRDAVLEAFLRYRKTEPFDKTVSDTATFLCRVKKGSRHIRKILAPSQLDFVPHNIIKFAETTDCIFNYKESPLINGLWGKSFFDNATRTFLFKLHNNTLGINARISHFVANQSRTCTFCNLTRNPDPEVDETVLHLFFQCRSTEPIVLGLQRWAIENEQQFQTVSRKNFFGVYNTENTYKNVILQIVAALIKKYIWDCKTRFSLPDLESGKDFIRYEMDRIISQSSKIYKAYFASDLNFIGDF
jgi:hypothetical protein